jgi:hypothetical protein
MSTKKKPKAKSKKKKTVLAPEVLSASVTSPQPLEMDGTSHVTISHMQNIYYSKEIIEETRQAFSIERLRGKLSEDKRAFLEEGKRQIYKLWHGIEALTVHNTMFVVLFLLSIGEVLNTVREELSLTDFVQWRRNVFSPKHDRYLQQARQLYRMGDFAKKYASMGKKRLLILDKLRKDENKDTFEALFDEHPIPEEIEQSLRDDEEVKQNPFPDSTKDMEGDLLKEHVDAYITYDRLKKAGISFVTFDQAYLIAAYKRDAIHVKRAKQIADWLQTKGNAYHRKKWFNTLLMNKMVFPDSESRQGPPRDSLNYLLANFNDYCEKSDFTNQEWLNSQSELIDEDVVRKSNSYLKKIARKLGIALSAR